MDQVFLLFLFVTLTIYWGYLLLFYLLTDNKKILPSQNASSKSVSVIICAKNEIANLQKNLSKVLEQDYDNFEVIVVDDQSTDETWKWLESVVKNNERLKILKSNPDYKLRGKKTALLSGIDDATNDWLLLADADCSPASKLWVTKMLEPAGDDCRLVLGYGPFAKSKGWFNKLVRFDAFMIALQYMSFAKMGLTYMGVGRNLLYEKSLFKEVGGFSKVENMLSGDDDLLVQLMAKKTNTVYQLDPNSFIYSDAEKDLSGFLRQKNRHHSTAFYYNFKMKLALVLFNLARFGSYPLMIIILMTRFSDVAIGLIFVHISLILLLHKKNTKTFMEYDFWLITPILDFLSSIIYVILAFKMFIRKEERWK